MLAAGTALLRGALVRSGLVRILRVRTARARGALTRAATVRAALVRTTGLRTVPARGPVEVRSAVDPGRVEALDLVADLVLVVLRTERLDAGPTGRDAGGQRRHRRILGVGLPHASGRARERRPRLQVIGGDVPARLDRPRRLHHLRERIRLLDRGLLCGRRFNVRALNLRHLTGRLRDRRLVTRRRARLSAGPGVGPVDHVAAIRDHRPVRQVPCGGPIGDEPQVAALARRRRSRSRAGCARRTCRTRRREARGGAVTRVRAGGRNANRAGSRRGTRGNRGGGGIARIVDDDEVFRIRQRPISVRTGSHFSVHAHRRIGLRSVGGGRGTRVQLRGQRAGAATDRRERCHDVGGSVQSHHDVVPAGGVVDAVDRGGHPLALSPDPTDIGRDVANGIDQAIAVDKVESAVVRGTGLKNADVSRVVEARLGVHIRAAEVQHDVGGGVAAQCQDSAPAGHAHDRAAAPEHPVRHRAQRAESAGEVAVAEFGCRRGGGSELAILQPPHHRRAGERISRLRLHLLGRSGSVPSRGQQCADAIEQPRRRLHRRLRGIQRRGVGGRVVGELGAGRRGA